MSSKKTYLLMLIGTFFWAGAFIAGKFGVATMSPVLLTYFRLLIAAAILYPIVAKREKNLLLLDRAGWRKALATGLVGMIGYHLFFFTALRYTSATKASVINAINPLLTAVLAALLLGEVIPQRKRLFILTAFVGVLLTITGWQPLILLSERPNIGDLLMLCGTSAWAFYGILVKRALVDRSALTFTAATFLSAVILLTPFAIFEMTAPGFEWPDPLAWWAVLYMAIFPTVIGYSIQQVAISSIGPSRTALFINLVPFFSMLLAFLMLGETIDPLNLASGLVIVTSVVLFLRRKPILGKGLQIRAKKA